MSLKCQLQKASVYIFLKRQDWVTIYFISVVLKYAKSLSPRFLINVQMLISILSQ